MSMYVLVKLSASLVFGAPFQDSTSEQLPLKCLINTEHAKAAHPHVRKVLQKLTGTRKRCSYISWNHVTSQISLQADQYWFVVRSRSICSPLMVRSIFLPASVLNPTSAPTSHSESETPKLCTTPGFRKSRSVRVRDGKPQLRGP